jgi:hypothetical protein
MILKQSTVYSRKFVMISNTDHVSGKTGLGGAVTVWLFKGISGAGGSSAQATNSPTGVIELDATNLPGQYQINLTNADVALLGDLSFHCTGAGADPTDFIDQVQTTVFTDLSISLANGRVNVTSPLIQNQPFTALFFMTQASTNNALPGLTVTGQRTFGVAGFTNIGPGQIAEVGGSGNGGGWYVFNGIAADSNNPVVGFKMSAPGANDTDFSLWFQP